MKKENVLYPKVKSGAGGDGVVPSIINSQRVLNCAGRSLLASKTLDALGIKHFVVSPAEHSLVIVERPGGQGYTYFDAQQGLLFNMDRDALKIDGDVSQGALASIDVSKT